MKKLIDRIESTLTNESGFGLTEVLIATIVLAFGLLAVAGLSLSTAGHERLARWQTDQAFAAQLALAQAYQADFDSVRSGTTAIDVGGHTYRVKLTVTDVSARVKQVDAAIAGVGPLDVKTFTTRLYAPRPLLGPVVLDEE